MALLDDLAAASEYAVSAIFEDDAAPRIEPRRVVRIGFAEALRIRGRVARLAQNGCDCAEAQVSRAPKAPRAA
jgi:hypothetical protein